MRQLIGQLRVRCTRLVERPKRLARRRPPPWPGLRWSPRGPFLPAGPQDNAPDAVLAGDLVFAGLRHHAGWPPDWETAAPSRLWRYHLHYLEPLWALDLADATTLARHWIREHPLGRGQAGWEPYPTSLRLANLCGVFFGRHRVSVLASPELRDELWASLHLQAEWLRRHLEIHLLANHLLENGIALAVVGSCFEGPAAARWRRTALGLLRRELPEQILADGGHFERSPMYQSRLAWALAFLGNIGDSDLDAAIRPALERCLEALRRLCHPDGEIALLNDSAFNMTNPAAEILEYGNRQLALEADSPSGGFSLPVTGYFGATTPAGDYLVVDAGPIGPDYQPGHGHADLFSFELSLAGQRLVVDSGNYDYEPSAERAYCRSTRAHNTVEIEGQDQCELWGAFRVGRRARPRELAFRDGADGFCLSAWHDGYGHLPGGPRHRRQVSWHDSGVVAVRDTVRAAAPVSCLCRLHLHPECRIVDTDRRRVTVLRGELESTIAFTGAGTLRRERGIYCPAFGVALENDVLVFESRSDLVRTGFVIARGRADVSLDLDAAVRVGRIELGW